MPGGAKNFEKERIRQLKALQDQLDRVYGQAVTTIAYKAASLQVKGQRFSLSAYPTLQKAVDQQLKKLHGEVYSITINGINSGWDLANDQNDVFVDKRLGSREPTLAALKILYDPNDSARQSFIKRKEKGLDLSQRVWNGLDPFPSELEAGLGIGISQGTSAAKLASDMKQYLKQPDKLFRRVRNLQSDPSSPLVLSRTAVAYHPGQGVYRSSYKNSLRLTRSENNMAYRNSDHERWQNIPFVVGFEIRLSNNHPRFDICDHLAGKYPKEFKWSGWHPQCLCNKIAIQMSDDEFDKYEDQILGRGTIEGPSINHVQYPPAAFSKYVKEHMKQIEGWKSKPYWFRDNPDAIQTALNPPIPKVVPPPKPLPTVVPKQPVKALTLRDELKSFTHPVQFELKVQQIFESRLGLKPETVNMFASGSAFPEELGKEKMIRYVEQIDNLLSDYEPYKGMKTIKKVTFKSNSGTYGFIQTSNGGGFVHEFNLGSRLARSVDRTRDLNSTTYRAKSHVDPENLELATVTHEFAHFITIKENSYFEDPRVGSFWRNITNIKSQYSKEWKRILGDRNMAEDTRLIEIQRMYLGNYAGTNANEFVAEAFTEYKLSANPSKYARLVGELIDKTFKRKK
jgi:hypothetical protein